MHECFTGQMPFLGEHLQDRPLQIPVEGRVDENDVEGPMVVREKHLRALVDEMNGCCRRCTSDSGAPVAITLEPSKASTQARKDVSGRLHQHHLGRAARHRLETERPAAGKQIQTACAGKVRLQPVEQGLAQAIGGGAQTGSIRHRQAAASPAPADQPHVTRSAMAFGGTCTTLSPRGR